MKDDSSESGLEASPGDAGLDAVGIWHPTLAARQAPARIIADRLGTEEAPVLDSFRSGKADCRFGELERQGQSERRKAEG